MITSAAATVLAGSLFLASTTTIESPIRDYRSYATAPSGYTAYCAREPDCDSRLDPRRSALLAPKSADSSARHLPVFGRMLVKERWFGNRIVTASAAPIGDPVKPAAARPVLLPMLLKERWFRDTAVTAAAVPPAQGPASAFAPMAHKERWLGNRIATASRANPRPVIPAQAGIQPAAVQHRKGLKRDSGFRQNDESGWSGRMTEVARPNSVSVIPAQAGIHPAAAQQRKAFKRFGLRQNDDKRWRVLLPMHLKEHWFRERTLTPAVVSPAVGPASAPMAHKERWFRTRMFAAALVGEPAHSGFRRNDESGWSGRMTEGARPNSVSVIPAQAGIHPAAAQQRKAFKRFGLRQIDDKRWRVLLPMHLKEHWFRERTLTPAAVVPAVGPATAPMAHKERWFRTRIFAAALDGEPAPSPKYAGGAILPKGGGRQQIGKPYKVAGHWFTPKEEPDYDVSGIASWYGSAFHRRMTSNGEWFDMEYLSAAHPTMPLPSYAKVTNMDNGSEIIVRVNDRGPFAAGRIIDLSKKCAESLGFRDRGTARVRVQYVGAAPLDDGGSHLRAMNRELRRGTAFEHMLGAADAASRTMAAASSTPAQDF